MNEKLDFSKQSDGVFYHLGRDKQFRPVIVLNIWKVNPKIVNILIIQTPIINHFFSLSWQDSSRCVSISDLQFACESCRNRICTRFCGELGSYSWNKRERHHWSWNQCKINPLEISSSIYKIMKIMQDTFNIWWSRTSHLCSIWNFIHFLFILHKDDH